MSADRPLSEAALMRRATAYLARRTASVSRVRAMLARAVARHARLGDQGERDEAAETTALESVLERLSRAGLLDDVAFGRVKAGSLARKGKPAGTIAAELKFRHGVDAGDDPTLRETLSSLDPLVQATRWAERKRLGPFRATGREERRERDIAALARAGFAVGVARTVVDGDGTVPPD